MKNSQKEQRSRGCSKVLWKAVLLEMLSYLHVIWPESVQPCLHALFLWGSIPVFCPSPKLYGTPFFFLPNYESPMKCHVPVRMREGQGATVNSTTLGWGKGNGKVTAGRGRPLLEEHWWWHIWPSKASVFVRGELVSRLYSYRKIDSIFEWKCKCQCVLLFFLLFFSTLWEK